jgi:hypothetical protein
MLNASAKSFEMKEPSNNILYTQTKDDKVNPVNTDSKPSEMG